MNYIRLHPKHGVNPTIPLCFWCGEGRNEVALLGAAYKGEAPHNLLLDYEPCDSCGEKMALGITLVEATQRPAFTHQRVIQEPDVYPTGKWWVMKEDAVKRIFTPGKTVEAMLEKRKAFIDPETAVTLGLYQEQADAAS